MAIDKKVFLFDLKCRPWPVYIYIHSNRKEITNIYIFCHFKRFQVQMLSYNSFCIRHYHFLLTLWGLSHNTPSELIACASQSFGGLTRITSISPSSEIHVEITSNFTDYSNEVKSYIIARYGDKTCSTSPQY